MKSCVSSQTFFESMFATDFPAIACWFVPLRKNDRDAPLRFRLDSAPVGYRRGEELSQGVQVMW